MRKFIYSLTTSIITAGVLVSALGVLVAPPVQAHGDEDDGHVAATNTTEASVEYSYVAQAGDSYTKIARKAIQTYGFKKKVSISQAKIIFAETNLTQEAGSPRLEIGQKVSIKESVVKKWVDSAQKLSAAQEAAWQYYVQFVDFNTSAIGQVRA